MRKSSKHSSPQSVEHRKVIALLRNDAIWIVLLGGLIYAAYAFSFQSAWQFDDGANIVNNPDIQIQDLSWNGLETAMQSHFAGKRPVAYLSFALNYYFAKLNPVPYHITSTVIHFINAILVLLLMKLFIQHCYPNSPAWYQNAIAFSVSALWACNPLQSQAVIYITQRMTLLVSMFLLMALIFYWKARTAPTSRNKWIHGILCALSFFCALGSKENAVIFPLLLAATEFTFFTRQLNLKRKLRLITMAMVIFASLGGFIIWNYHLTKFLKKALVGGELTLMERLMTESRVVLYYISQLLLPLPSRLAVLPDVQKSSSLFEPLTTFFSILTIFGLFGIAIWQWRRRPMLSYAISWYFIGHLVESTILPIDLMFEHRAYFPSVGVFMVLFSPLLEWGGAFAKMKYYRWIGVSTTALLLISVSLVWIRSHAWSDELSLWLDNTEKYPANFKGLSNLGSSYEKRGEWGQAERAYQQSLSANPNHPTARANLAILLQSRGRNAEALKLLENQNAEHLQGKGYYALGLIYANLGQMEKSIANYRRAIEVNKGPFPQAHFNLGLVNIKTGHIEEAQSCFLQFLILWTKNPSDPFVIKAHRQLEALQERK